MLFIALRYLIAHTRQTAICVLGVMISVTMFMVMTSMMGGFTDKFIIETVESSGHITVHDEPRELETPILQTHYANPDALLVIEGSKPRVQTKKIKNATGLEMQLRRMPGVVATAPMVYGDVIASYGTKTMSMSVYGIDPRKQLVVTTIGENLIAGSFDRLETTSDGVVVGRGVAQVLGLHLNDNVAIASPTGGRTTGKIVGIFETGVTPVDYGRAYMLLSSAQTLLDKKNVINDIVLRTDDYTKAREYAQQIEAVAGYKTESWQEANANFLKIFRIQTIITYVITAALLIVAAFGVLNILIMAVLERVNDIAILKSFGYSRNDVTKIYMVQGLVIGIVGSTVGLLAAKGLIELLRKLPIQMEGLVKAEGLLMSEHGSDYVTAFCASMIVVIAASAYPARRAAGYDPVEVIRGAR